MAEWIKCEDRLPKAQEKVLVCFINRQRKKISTKYDGKLKTSIRIDAIEDRYGTPFWKKGNTPAVMAWMPLPKPLEINEDDWLKRD